jgi:hypothetical protein
MGQEATYGEVATRTIIARLVRHGNRVPIYIEPEAVSVMVFSYMAQITSFQLNEA